MRYCANGAPGSRAGRSEGEGEMVRRLALYNGVIHTLNEAAPRVEAVGIVGERIVAAGTNDAVRAARRRNSICAGGRPCRA